MFRAYRGNASSKVAFADARSKLHHRHGSETFSKSLRVVKPATPDQVRIVVDHLTEYHYDEPVSFGEHLLHLRPRESHILHVERFSLECSPVGKLRWLRDCFNNIVAAVSFGLVESPLLSFHGRMVFDVAEENPFDFILETRATQFPFAYDERERVALSPYLEPEESARWRILDWARDLLGDPAKTRDTLSFLTDVNLAIHRSIRYERRDDEGVQTANETLERKKGSCRDMAELFVATGRQLGLAARFVSGYLYEPPARDGRDVLNRAAGSMHAWAEVYLPGAGWRGFDPTNGILTDHHFIPAAVANRPQWASPIQGKYFHGGNVGSRMTVRLNIEEL